MGKLIIAKTGGTVDDTEKDLAFTSGRDCLVEIQNESIVLSTDSSGNGTYNITHNLNYSPYVIAHIKDNTTGYYYPFDFYDSFITTTQVKFKITGGDANTDYYINCIIFGNRQDNAVGSGNNNVTGKLKIAKSGYSSDIEIDARNMIFFSGGNVLKIDNNLSGSVVVNVNNYPSPTVTTIAHNLGYKPLCFVFNVIESRQLPFSEPLFGSDQEWYDIDDTNLYIYSYRYIDPVIWTYKYKILRDKIA